MHLHTVFSCSKHILKLSTIEQTDVRPHSRCKTSTETHDMLRQSCTHTHTHTLSHMPHHVRCVAVATERLTRSTMTSTQGRTVGRVCANISFPSYFTCCICMKWWWQWKVECGCWCRSERQQVRWFTMLLHIKRDREETESGESEQQSCVMNTDQDRRAEPSHFLTFTVWESWD